MPGSLGIPRIAWLGRLGRISPTGMNEYAFYDTSLDDCIDNAFQGLALDEKRAAFTPSIWEKRGNDETVSDASCTPFETAHIPLEADASMVRRRPFQHRRLLRRSRARKHHPGLDDVNARALPRHEHRLHCKTRPRERRKLPLQPPTASNVVLRYAHPHPTKPLSSH